MLANIAIGCLLVLITTVIHAAAMVLALWASKVAHVEQWDKRSRFTRMSVVSALVLLMFMAAVVEAVVWAAAYLIVDAMPDAEQAMYFSTVTYTTLGFGDVTIEGQWRLLSAFQAANGIIMFGWTTALIVAAVQRIYFPGPARDSDRR